VVQGGVIFCCDAFDPRPLTPEQLAAFMETEIARWTPIAQAAMKK
jgi:hypothetical protein